MWTEHYLLAILFESFDKEIIFILAEFITSFNEGEFFGDRGFNGEADGNISPLNYWEFGEELSVWVSCPKNDQVRIWGFHKRFFPSCVIIR